MSAGRVRENRMHGLTGAAGDAACLAVRCRLADHGWLGRLCVATLLGLTVAAGAGHTGAATPVMATQSIGAVGPGSHTYVGTWAAAPQPPHDTGRSAYGFDNQTIRQIVHTHTGGSSVRVRLGNTYSSRPLTIGRADVAWSAGGAAIAPGTARPLTFGKSASIVIPPGADVLSDPVVFNIPANR